MRKRIEQETWTFTTLKKKTAADWQMLVRLRAADRHGRCKCVTCGKEGHYKQMDAGHFVSGWRVKFHEQNCHPQCKQCNYWLSGNREEYALFMRRTYGQRTIDQIYRLSNRERKYTREELFEMRAKFRAEAKQIRSRL